MPNPSFTTEGRDPIHPEISSYLRAGRAGQKISGPSQETLRITIHADEHEDDDAYDDDDDEVDEQTTPHRTFATEHDG